MVKSTQQIAIEQAVDLIAKSNPDWTKTMGKDGLLKEMSKALLEKALQAEMSEHLGCERHERESGNPNARNGVSRKTIYTEHGAMDLEVPRDRTSHFEPVIVPKRTTVMDGLDDKILSLYAKGMPTPDISLQL